MHLRIAICVTILSALMAGRTARGLIKVSMPISKTYEQSDCVLIGTIANINPDNRVLDVKLNHAVKGQMYGDRFRIQIAAPAEVIGQVAASQPAVVFASEAGGRSIAAIHVADRWLLAERIANISPPAWRVHQAYDDLKQSFPGRTAALVRIVESIKAGRGELLNEVNVELLGKAVPAGRLGVVEPAGLLAADVNGDGELDLVVWAGGQFRLFVQTESEYRDASADFGGPWASKSPLASAGDVDGDGRADLLLGGQLLLSRGGKFQAVTFAGQKIDPASLLAVALVDANGNGRADAVFLTGEGMMHVRLNPGTEGGEWAVGDARPIWEHSGQDRPLFAAIGDFGDDGQPAVIVVRGTGLTRHALCAGRQGDDFERMTGTSMQAYAERFGKGIKAVWAATLDANGDGRADLLVVTDAGALLMVNRGFGAFMVDADAAKAFRGASNPNGQIELAEGWAVSPGETGENRAQELLVVDRQGRLFRIK